MLTVDDIVYFQKVISELSSKWSLGIVTEIEKGKDGLVRRATIKYQNSSEDAPRFTDRAARSLIKLFHINDQDWMEEMSEVERLIFDLKAPDLREEISEEPDDVDTELSEKKVTPLKLVKRKNNEYKVKDRSKLRIQIPVEIAAVFPTVSLLIMDETSCLLRS